MGGSLHPPVNTLIYMLPQPVLNPVQIKPWGIRRSIYLPLLHWQCLHLQTGLVETCCLDGCWADEWKGYVRGGWTKVVTYPSVITVGSLHFPWKIFYFGFQLSLLVFKLEPNRIGCRKDRGRKSALHHPHQPPAYCFGKTVLLLLLLLTFKLLF